MAATAVAQEWDAQGNPIQASSGGSPTEWDASGKPLTTPPADNRSLLQKAKDKFADIQKSFDTNTATSPSEPLLETGIKSVVGAIGTPFVHPVDTAKGILKTAVNPVGAGEAIGQGIGQDYKSGGVPYAATKLAGQVFGGTALGEGIGAAPEAIANASRIPDAIALGKARAGQTLYPKNVSIPPQQVAAQNFIKALVPDADAIPNIKSAAGELPDVLASAEKNGTPINGKLDAAKAIRDRAAEVQAQYNDKILRPNAGDINTVPDNYSGNTAGAPNRATLSQINDRVDAINAELKSNFRKKLPSQTTEANASDADLLSEKQGLTEILHSRLADLTGLQPEDIASLRQRAGKLRGLAQEVEVSADRDTVAAGRRATSGGSLSIKNPIEGVIDKASGGQEVIGNRVFKNALDQFQPAENPLPQPKPPGDGVATTPEMAQQEFLRQQQLEQASQASAAGRSQAVQTYRGEQAANNQAAAQVEATRAIQTEQAAQDAAAQRGAQASTSRLDSRAMGATKWASEGYTKVVQHLANDASSGIARSDLVKIAQTPQGNSLLVRASGLTPGSPMMRGLVQQIKALVH